MSNSKLIFYADRGIIDKFRFDGIPVLFKALDGNKNLCWIFMTPSSSPSSNEVVAVDINGTVLVYHGFKEAGRETSSSQKVIPGYGALSRVLCQEGEMLKSQAGARIYVINCDDNFFIPMGYYGFSLEPYCQAAGNLMILPLWEASCRAMSLAGREPAVILPVGGFHGNFKDFKDAVREAVNSPSRKISITKSHYWGESSIDGLVQISYNGKSLDLFLNGDRLNTGFFTQRLKVLPHMTDIQLKDLYYYLMTGVFTQGVDRYI